ncbi:chromosome segregation in meiosis-related protein [Cryptotrichosporon argae]
MASLADLFSTSSPPRARVVSPARSASPTTPVRSAVAPLFFSPRSPSPSRSLRPADGRGGSPSRPSRPLRRDPLAYDGLDDFDAYGAETFGMADGVGEGGRGGDALDPLAIGLGDDKPRKTRAPVAKVDYDRLSGENGFPALMRAAKRFRVKGKGHEASDLARLLDVYQLWAHRMFPKGDFAHTVSRIEAVCRSRRMRSTLAGYRDAFHPPPSPPRDAPDHNTVDAPDDAEHDAALAAAEAEADDEHASPGRAPKRRRSSEPLFDPRPDAYLEAAAGDAYDGPDEDELAELAAMEEEEARAAGGRHGGVDDDAPQVGPEDEWDDDLYA